MLRPERARPASPNVISGVDFADGKNFRYVSYVRMIRTCVYRVFHDFRA